MIQENFYAQKTKEELIELKRLCLERIETIDAILKEKKE